MKEISEVICGQSVEIVNDNKMSFEDMKEVLLEYRELDREIDNEIERLERIEQRMFNTGGSGLNGMPSNPSPIYDKIGNVVSKKIDIENSIKKLIIERDNTLEYLKDLIKQLKKADERAVLRMKYIDFEDWYSITFMLFGNKKDFNYNMENYKQRAYRLHKSAIYNLIDAVTT